MPRPTPTLLALPLALAALPASALAAPTIATNKDCYLDSVMGGQRVTPSVILSGRGFTPSAAYQVTLDGQPVPGPTRRFDGLGAFSGVFAPPSLTSLDRREKRWTVRVEEGANSARAIFRTSDVFADFSPTKGDPSKLRVRFSAWGFKLDKADGASDPSVYLHYVTPRGRLKRTVRVGRAQGVCGRLDPTAKRRLFPFRPSAGRWSIQVDTRPRYTRARSSSSFVSYTIRVRVSDV